MSRLIDADKLKDKFNSRQMYTGAIIKELIDMQSTAYYPKYVIEELEELKDISSDHYALDEAIEIVKAGGVDE